jgi:hypothetical protein
MSPSRGKVAAKPGSDDEAAVQQQGNSALVNARRNFSFLISPDSASDRPARLRTRAFLRSIRYLSQFIIWRLVKWAKYVAVGGLVAAVGATAFGGVMTGAAWIAAPPTIGASIIAACVWGVGKFAARKLHQRWKTTGKDVGEAEREHLHDHPVKSDGSLGLEMGPRAVPW